MAEGTWRKIVDGKVPPPPDSVMDVFSSIITQKSHKRRCLMEEVCELSHDAIYLLLLFQIIVKWKSLSAAPVVHIE